MFAHDLQKVVVQIVSKLSCVIWRAVAAGSRSVMKSQLAGGQPVWKVNLCTTVSSGKEDKMGICPSSCHNHKDKQPLTLIVCWQKIKKRPLGKTVHFAPFSTSVFILTTNDIREEWPPYKICDCPLLYCCWTGNKCQQSSTCNGWSLYNWGCCISIADGAE